MSSVPPDGSGLTETDRDTVRRHAICLDLRPADMIEKLSVGQSGALVVRLIYRGQPAVLKITTDPARLERAGSELRMIAEAAADLAAVMPRFITGRATEHAVSLVTEEHRALPSPSRIDDADWLAIARALAALQTAPLPTWPQLALPQFPTAAAVVQAEKFWTERGHRDDAAAAASLILERREQQGREPWDTILEHGDCHTENIVRDESGTFRWIDWQEAHLGNGFGDLVFLWHRAEFGGATPPRSAMTSAYADARDLHPDEALQREIDLAELRLLFVSWPPFLAYGSRANQERMTARLPRLVAALSCEPKSKPAHVVTGSQTAPSQVR